MGLLFVSGQKGITLGVDGETTAVDVLFLGSAVERFKAGVTLWGVAGSVTWLLQTASPVFVPG